MAIEPRRTPTSTAALDLMAAHGITGARGEAEHRAKAATADGDLRLADYWMHVRTAILEMPVCVNCRRPFNPAEEGTDHSLEYCSDRCYDDAMDVALDDDAANAAGDR